MPENEFEKQVQQKMDELKFDPSTEVWENVATAIAKRKKHRWGYAIIFLSLLLVGASVFMLFNDTSYKKNNEFISKESNSAKDNNTERNGSNISTINDTANSVTSVNKTDTVVNGTIAKMDNADTKKINDPKPSATLIPEIQNPTVKEGKLESNNSVKTNNAVYSISNKEQHKAKQKLRASVSNGNAEELINKKVAPVNTSKSIPQDVNTIMNDIVVNSEPIDTFGKSNGDSSGQIGDTLVIKLSEEGKKDSAIKNAVQPRQRSKWELGFNFSFGATTTQGGYIGIGSGNNELYSFASSSQSPGNNSGQVSYVNTTSAIKPGTGIIVGLFVQKNISPKTKILFGLNYRVYSSVMVKNVSTVRYDSASNGSGNLGFGSSSNTSGRYKNNFHFLEMPVAMEFKLSKENKLPVYLNTGISIAQLLGSNVQQFYAYSAQYSNNNDPLNKTQFSLSAGLLFSLSGQAKKPFLIGPNLSFSVSKMANSGLYKSSHYSYLGILIQKNIGKK